jgi:hypothetical protein
MLSLVFLSFKAGTLILLFTLSVHEPEELLLTLLLCYSKPYPAGPGKITSFIKFSIVLFCLRTEVP